jgi:DNA-binding MarR family transcriptional regulator
MKVAKAKGRLRGKQPKLKPAQEAHLVELWRAGKHTSAELAELFSVARATVYRASGGLASRRPPGLAEREQPHLRRPDQAGGLRQRRRDSHRHRRDP